MQPFQYTPIDFSQYQPKSYYPEYAVDTSGYYAGVNAAPAGAAQGGGIGQTVGQVAGVVGGKYLGGKAIGAGKAALGIGTTGAATTAGAAPIASVAGSAIGSGVTTPLTFAGGSSGAFGTAAGSVPAASSTLGAGGAAGGAGAASSLGAAVPYAAGAAGAYGLYDLVRNPESSEIKAATQGVGSGAALGFAFGGPIGAGIGAIAGGLFGLGSSFKGFRTGKGKDQIARDKVRKALVSSGALGKDYQLKLPGGKTFDIGQDGKKFATHSDVDFSKPGIDDVVAGANPLALAITGGNPKLQSDFAGYFTNAAVKNSETPTDAFNNLRSIATQLKLDPQTLHSTIDAAKDKLSDEQFKVYHGSVDSLFGGYYDEKAKESYYQLPDKVKQRLIKPLVQYA
jgi:hypothetical protein